MRESVHRAVESGLAEELRTSSRSGLGTKTTVPSRLHDDQQKRVRLNFFDNCTAFPLEIGLQMTRHKLRVSYRNTAYLDTAGFVFKLFCWVGNADVWLVLRLL
jgi:hypothetical protein